jgi:hypothetical protein
MSVGKWSESDVAAHHVINLLGPFSEMSRAVSYCTNQGVIASLLGHNVTAHHEPYQKEHHDCTNYCRTQAILNLKMMH